jgi:hypothetical protein
MTISHIIANRIATYNSLDYHFIELRIILKNSVIKHYAAPFELTVSDDVNTIHSFSVTLSGNQSEVSAFFTTDAFSAFTDKGLAHLFCGNLSLLIRHEIDVVNVPPLSTMNSNVPHLIGDNNWLNSL